MKQLREVSELFHVLTLLNSKLTLDHLLPRALDLSLELTRAERALVMVYDSKGELSIRAARNYKKEDLNQEDFLGSSSIVKEVLLSGKHLYLPNLQNNPRFAEAGSVRRWNLQSAICIPLSTTSEAEASKNLGVLYIDSSADVPSLSLEDLHLTEALANHIAISILNAKLLEEVLTKNQRIELLNQKLQKRIETQASNLSEMKTLLAETQREVAPLFGLGNIVGKSKPMRQLFTLLEKVTPTGATVLVHGESGTGKELIARYIHYNGPRADRPMVSVNCSSLNENLLESELFGHVKGSFSGAYTSKAGLFQIAHGGTLFLDEVGDMSLEMQGKLLRVLEDGEIRPVGGNESSRVDVRIIAATNKNLQGLVKAGKFREDLFFRLHVIALDIPPLRERREDIPLLIEFIQYKISDELERPLPSLSQQTFSRLINYDWPGNVRELENELRRIFILDSDHVQFLSSTTSTTSENEMSFSAMEKGLILKALQKENGNKSKAAKLLKISRRTFYRKLIKYNIF